MAQLHALGADAFCTIPAFAAVAEIVALLRADGWVNARCCCAEASIIVIELLK